MSNRLYYATELPFALDAVWPFLDYPAPGWTLSGGGPREVGTLRRIEIPEVGLIVDRLLAYEAGDNVRQFKYAIVNDDNFLGAKGYEGHITVMRNTADPNTCFFRYTSRWDSAQQDVPAVFGGLMDGMVQQIIAQATDAAAA